MVESGSQPFWVSVAEASRMLEISETAVRKRVRVGTLLARGDRGSTEVLIGVVNQTTNGSQLKRAEPEGVVRNEAERLAAELAEVRARLADVQLERDRWHRIAVEARADARDAEAALRTLERELRILLDRS